MYLIATPSATATGNVFPLGNDVRRQLEIKTYQNDLQRLEERLNTLTLTHGILMKWDMQGRKSYSHDKRREDEMKIQEIMRAMKAIRTQINVLEAK